MVGSTRGLKGAEEAKATLREIVAEIQNGDKVAGPALDKATDAMMDLIDARTPVLTGNLRENNDKRKLDNYKIEIFNDTEYGPYVHNGTSRMPPRPFIESSIDELVELLPEIYVENASEFVKKVQDKNRPT